MSIVTSSARFAKNILSFASGYAIYQIKKQTPKYAYVSMRSLFCQTNGTFNNVVAKLETGLRKEYAFNNVTGILGNLGKSDIKQISDAINENGYYRFPQLLSKDKIEALINFSRTTPALPRMQNNLGTMLYNSESPVSPIYDFSSQTLFETPTVQELLTDESVLAVAQEYLGNRPVLDLLTMWWSTAACQEVDLSKAAQLYHFDLDRLKFLKFFIYLSDVDTNNGPHCYIEKSHRIKPKAVRKDGRIFDHELESHYPAGDFKEITGPTGTILAVDTSGFHKGKPLEKGERLLFQMEFATSLFGQNYPSSVKNDKMGDAFLKKIEQYKDTFDGILK